MPQSTGSTNYPVTGSPSNTSETTQKLFESFDAVCTAEEKLDNVEKAVCEAFPDTYDMCDITSFTGKLSGIIGDLTSVQKGMVAAVSNGLSDSMQYDTGMLENMNEDIQISVDSRYTNFVATQIILKKFQIIKYRIEKVRKTIQVIEAKTVKAVLESLLKGKGSAANPVLTPPIMVLQALAQVINVIMQIINVIVAVISNIPIMSVDAAGMCFFMTPKSFNTAKMQIMNVKKSINDTTPDPIAKAISTVQQKINESNGLLKKTKVATMAAAGAATAGANFNPGEFGTLEPFNPKIIKTAVNLILMTLLDAEPVPRFEKLSPLNIRFMVWLVTGFVPAGKKSFGIPGFP